MFLKDFARLDKVFVLACELAGVKNTRRQASRWHQQRGSAYKMRNEAQAKFAKDTAGQ